MTAPSSYRLEQAMSVFQALASRLDVAPEGDDAALSAALSDAEADCTTLLRRIILASIEAKVFAVSADERMETLRERRDRFRARAETLRATAFAVMDALGESKITDPEFTAFISKGRAQAIVTDETVLPECYWKITRAPMLTAIDSDIKAGMIVPGAEMVTSLPTLRIATK